MTNKKNVAQIFLDFLKNPFRLYFLLAAISLVPIAFLWLNIGFTAYFNLPHWALKGDVLSYHAYAYLNIFGAAAFAGFILTAMPEWTHFTASLHRLSALSLFVWLIGIACSFYSLHLSAAVMSIFWLLLTGFSVFVSYSDRNRRQGSVILILAVITALNIAYAGLAQWHLLVALAHAYLLAVSLIMFRIGMAMGAKAIEQAEPQAAQLSFVQNPYYLNLNIICLYLYLISVLFMQEPVFSGWLALAAGFSTLARLRDWHHLILWRAVFVRWHYISLLSIGIGYSWLGLSGILARGNPSQALHFMLLAGFILMVMQVFNIAGLIHSGLRLHFPCGSRLALVAILLAALLRSLSLSLAWDYALFSLLIPSALLIFAFALYLPVFFKIFITTEALPPEPRRY